MWTISRRVIRITGIATMAMNVVSMRLSGQLTRCRLANRQPGRPTNSLTHERAMIVRKPMISTARIWDAWCGAGMLFLLRARVLAGPREHSTCFDVRLSRSCASGYAYAPAAPFLDGAPQASLLSCESRLRETSRSLLNFEN